MVVAEASPTSTRTAINSISVKPVRPGRTRLAGDIAARPLGESLSLAEIDARDIRVAARASLPVIAVVFYLAVSVLSIIEPLRRIRIRTRGATQPE